MNLILQIIYPYIPNFTGICIVFLFFREYQEQFSNNDKNWSSITIHREKN